MESALAFTQGLKQQLYVSLRRNVPNKLVFEVTKSKNKLRGSDLSGSPLKRNVVVLEGVRLWRTKGKTVGTWKRPLPVARQDRPWRDKTPTHSQNI